MPSVEMRRSTRIFVPKAKDGEMGRVLRSGRRLWVESTDVKHKGGKNGDEWYPLISSDTNKCKKQKINGWNDDPIDVDETKPVKEIDFKDENEINDGRKTIKNVYIRKRKRFDDGRKSESHQNDSENKKFGLHFVRKRSRNWGVSSHQKGLDYDKFEQDLLLVVVESSCVGFSLFSSVLSSILRYISKDRIELAELFTYLVSIPISPLFSSSGIQFLLNRPPIERKGVCWIFGVKQFVAMFKVDFSAIPRCFQQLHSALFIRSVRLSYLWLIDFERKNDSTDEPLPCINDQSDESPVSRVAAHAAADCKVVKVASSSKEAGKTCSRYAQPTRVGVLTRSAAKRRRRSSRSRRTKYPLPFVPHKSSWSPVPIRVPKKNVLALPSIPKQDPKRSRKSSLNEIVENPSSSGMNVDIDAQCCSTNILVVETDKCYRVEGAEVTLDVSASNEWLLVVKKEGLVKHSFKVQREMRPGTTNRYTHAVIWTGENGWKLEFPDRNEWVVFKELYKVCGERNIVPTSPVVKIIPVPGVCEVTNLWDSPGAFQRPESYIRTTSDELSRTLSKRTANYDMDSEDEEWLSKFNSELDASNHVSDENFESIIDAFEKASYFNQEEANDEKTAANLCMDVASVEAAVPVYRYWSKKRKLKRFPLIKLNQPAKPHMFPKPVLRKKRSLKRPTIQPNQRQQGRGKNSTVLQAILKVQDAKASASKSVELAICKRKRAQLLTENADLAMYRAIMALRIADASEILDSEQAANHFLDEN
ncbi:uncharacterized protein LOC130817728 isoform X2 [Amaranthus tricolor]|uniref:uncharacterized protein LOC130817728 isoform X2 n=1 Tax=Amaranthus tricolor TaxID=29722 RepID=UPI00258A2EDF|nr:uncharacterized protein LOC130817728 isoform X2 [Amaranthus tricolor]